MADPFARLPTELLLHVLKDLDDLAVVHSLRCASPAAAAVFQSDRLAVEILEAVLAKSLGRRLHVLVRATCLLLARPPTSWTAFWDNLQATAAEWPPYVGGVGRGVEYRPLAYGDASAADVRHLLALASAVYAAVNRCLHTLLARCAQLRPRRPCDPAFNWRLWQYWCSLAGEPDVPANPIPDEPVCDASAMVAAAAPPVLWVEAQRALHAGWQLAFYSVLRAALASESADTRRRATATTPTNMAGVAVNVAANVYADFKPGHDPLESPLLLWRRMYRVVYRDVRGLETLVEADTARYHRPVRLPAPPGPPCLRLADAFPEARAAPVFDYTGHAAPMPRDWYRHPDGLGAIQKPSVFANVVRFSHWGPLQDAHPELFRRLGAYIWEHPRMVALHLVSGEATRKSRFGGNPCLTEYSDVYTWHSLLTDEERLAVQTFRRAIYERV
ncbi:hypothetical protein SPI_06601 [Niveomyces insectorum RCEF 264]|uniref:F-box domain-containing protein n=1 Tax=Niveomyces insectorum RCEF 264 TaxID=1081102 RepID=A0A167RF08_9HYPO|nr:hypothetical protein SPI_06601 [Niveomyces insectorum RCEF 264]